MGDFQDWNNKEDTSHSVNRTPRELADAQRHWRRSDAWTRERNRRLSVAVGFILAAIAIAALAFWR
jgi:hypothetical protein